MGPLRDRLVQIRVERLALRLDAGDAEATQGVEQFGVNRLNALRERPRFAGLFRGRQRPFEVVQGGEEFLHQRRDGVLALLVPLPRGLESAYVLRDSLVLVAKR